MRYLTLLALAAFLVLGVSCGDDDPAGPGGDRPVYGDLTRRIDVLNNFQLAYNRRDVVRYDELLASGFTFHFSPGDVAYGRPEEWGRAEELWVATKMFDNNYAGPYRVGSLQLDVAFEDGVQWVEFVPPGSPGETWYSTTVFYSFTIVVAPDLTLVGDPGIKAQFTVRNTGTEDAPRWQLVEMYDLGASSLYSAASVEPSTIGTVKALYAD